MMVVMTPRELMTDYLAAAKRGDWDTAFDFVAEDIVIHIPGRSAFAGDRRGKGGRGRLHPDGTRTATATGASSSS